MKQLSKCFRQLCRCCWMADMIQNSRMEMSLMRWPGWYQNNQGSEKSVQIGLVFWCSSQLLPSARPVGCQDWGTIWTAVSNQRVRTWGRRAPLRPSGCLPATPSSSTHGTRLPAFSLRSKAKLVGSPLMVQISGNRATESRKDTTWANKHPLAFRHEFPKPKHSSSVEKDRLPGKENFASNVNLGFREKKKHNN